MKARLNCPHCGHEALTIPGKLLVGPVTHKRCHHCAREVGISWKVLMFMLPVVIITLLFQLSSELSTSISAMLLGMTSLCLYQVCVVRLEKR